LAALESLASGTPVVASNTSAVGEFLKTKDGNCVGLTADNNGAAFADSIEELLAISTQDINLRQRCRTQAENFPWSKTIFELNSLHQPLPIKAA
jgi:alpha-1,6-mannosyltransferase